MTIKKQEEKSNDIINALWIGKHLSLIEILTIRSFLDNGHSFRLFVYEEIATPLPEGCELADANSILPESAVFRYKNKSQYGQGKGSVSGFSDIFRYKMLHDLGGWWVDMDVTCLKHFDFDEEYIFRYHHELPAVGNVMKCPKGSPLMLKCFEEAYAQVNADNRDWHLPIKILTDNIMAFGLDKHIREDFSNHDQWNEVRELLLRKKKLPDSYYCIHWMNENWRSKGLDKNDFKIDSVLGELLIRYGLIADNFSYFNRVKNAIRFGLLKGL